MKLTQRMVLNLYKTIRVNILAFDENNKRYSTYGNLNIVSALIEICRKTTLGYKVLIIDPNKDDTVNWEITNKTRVTYEIARNWVFIGREFFDLY